MEKPKPPTPPDPTVTANAQTGSNIDTAVANSYLGATNQNTPFGSVNFSQTGTQNVGGHDVPTFTSTQTLDPKYQQILDNVTGIVNSPFSLGGLPSLNSDLDRNKYTDQLLQRTNQDFARDDAANDVKLANQGIGVGSEAYSADKTNLARALTDARTQAYLSSGQEQSRQFGLNLSARQQGIAENQTARQEPINELATLLGFTPGLQTSKGAVAPTDIAGITQNSFADQQANYQQQMAQQNALWSGLFGLGTAGILKSDRRLKSNIRRVGELPSGLPVYAYEKFGRPEIGVMAQDVEKVMPWAVYEMPDGFKAVDYMELR